MTATPTGFEYPLASPTLNDTNWLERAPSYPVAGKIHLGSDLPASNGTPVFAVSGGTVIGRQSDGEGNEVIFIRHASTNGTFVGVYGHVKGAVFAGAKVSPGQQIASVGDYGPAGPAGDHLHFGVRPGTSVPPSDGVNYGWGRESITWYNANGPNGFTAPIAYITSNRPKPTDVRATPISAGSVTLSWNRASTQSAGSMLQYWSGSSWQTFGSLSPTVTSVRVNASAGSTFAIRVVEVQGSNLVASDYIWVTF